MKRSPVAASLLLLVATILLISVADPATALKCWFCSSESTPGKFCEDPFNELAIGDLQRRISYVRCVDPPQEPIDGSKQQQVVCKKSQIMVNETLVIKRSCHWVDIDTPAGQCPTQEVQPSVGRLVKCQTCITDGCNGKP